VFGIRRAGLVGFPSEPTHVILLFAPKSDAGRFELRFGRQTRVIRALDASA